eukprot:SAG31_NODE_1847_length_7095_cov_11.530875_6_plen_78_part_00
MVGSLLHLNATINRFQKRSLSYELSLAATRVSWGFVFFFHVRRQRQAARRMVFHDPTWYNDDTSKKIVYLRRFEYFW